MLRLSVSRFDDAPVPTGDASPEVLFYDESINVHLSSAKPCEVHLYIAVVGRLHEREAQHSIVICDDSLPTGKKWTRRVHVRHPRSPLQEPSLEIVATAKYEGDEDEASISEADNVSPLSSFLPSLQEFPSGDEATLIVPFDSPSDTAKHSGLGHAHSRSTDFAALYEERRNSATSDLVPLRRRSQTPSSGPHDEEGGSIGVVRWRVPLKQALELEIRSVRPALEKDRVIAEVDFVAGSHAVEVLKCDVELEDGLADPMGNPVFPMQLDPRGKYALCFNLQLRAAPQPLSMSQTRRPLTICLECTVNLRGDKEHPQIFTLWTPMVDFEGTQGPIPKTPALALPLHSPVMSMSQAPLSNSSSTLDLVTAPRGSGLNSANLSLMNGVTIMISGPQFVKVNQKFEWAFKILNRSQRSRMFSIGFGGGPRDIGETELVVPGADLLSFMSNYTPDTLRRRAAMHYRNIGANRGIVPLCQELRIYNLAPHACFETTIQLQALKPGTHSIESSRIEDLSNRDFYDVGGLLEVIVEAE